MHKSHSAKVIQVYFVFAHDSYVLEVDLNGDNFLQELNLDDCLLSLGIPNDEFPLGPSLGSSFRFRKLLVGHYRLPLVGLSYLRVFSVKCMFSVVLFFTGFWFEHRHSSGVDVTS